MKFIVDGGNGTVSQLAVRDLLTDIASPYPDAVFVTEFVPRGTMFSHVYREGTMGSVETILKMFDETNFATWNTVPDIMTEVKHPGDKILIIVGSAKPELVNYCLDNLIQVLDLEKGLYPVTDKVT